MLCLFSGAIDVFLKHCFDPLTRDFMIHQEGSWMDVWLDKCSTTHSNVLIPRGRKQDLAAVRTLSRPTPYPGVLMPASGDAPCIIEAIYEILGFAGLNQVLVPSLPSVCGLVLSTTRRQINALWMASLACE